MKERVSMAEGCGASVERRVIESDQLHPAGVFTLEHWRDGELLHSEVIPNLITNEGKNKLLSVMFNAGSQITTWYLGLISSTGYTAVAATDVYAQIGGTNAWTEFTGYTDDNNTNSATTRPQWLENAPSAQSITNTSIVSVTITGAGTVKGLFLVGGGSSQTKGDATAGATLWCATLFTGGDRIVAVNDVLKLTYSVST